MPKNQTITYQPAIDNKRVEAACHRRNQSTARQHFPPRMPGGGVKVDTESRSFNPGYSPMSANETKFTITGDVKWSGINRPFKDIDIQLIRGDGVSVII